jgi:polyferredoxin
MAADQFSEKPLPQEKRCPYCGAVAPSTAAACWMCHRSIRKSPEGQKIPPRRMAARLLFGVVILVVSGMLAWAAPGALVPVLAVALPLFVRTANSANRKRNPSFLLLFGITILVLAVSFIACSGALNAFCNGSPELIDYGWFASLALATLGGAGVVAAFIVGIELLFRYTDK